MIFPCVMVFSGVLMAILEIFIFPGLGIPGVIGFLSFFGGLGYTGYMVFSAKTISMGYAGFALSVSIISSLIFSVFMTKILKNSSIGKSMILEETLDSDKGFNASNDELVLYYGEQGETMTALKPCGSVMLKGDRMSVVSEEGYIEKGTEVEVTNVEDNTLYVKAVSQEADKTKKLKSGNENELEL